MPVLFTEAILIFTWLWRANNIQGYLFKKTAFDRLIASLVFLAGLSFIFSIYKHDSFFALITLLGYIGIYYLILNEFDSRMIRRLLYIVISICSGLSLYGILQYLNVLDHSWWISDRFLAATFVNHNHFAGYLELVIPLTIGAMLEKGAKSRLILTMALIFMTTAFILTQSRGGWISLGIALFIMGIVIIGKSRRDKKNILILIVFIGFITAMIYFAKDAIAPRIETIVSMEVKEASFDSRLKIWAGTIEMIGERPLLGTGIGTFIWAFPTYRPQGLNARANFAHNDYLNIAAEIGIPAAIIIIWLIIAAVRAGLSKINFRFQTVGCSIGILSVALHGLVDFNFHILSNMLLFIIYIAVVTGDYDSFKRTDDNA